MGFWTKSLLIFNSIRENAKQSIRQIAHQTGLSKSSVHRLKQSMDRRDRHPESWWWETQEGHSWLVRLVVATLYTFGFKRGVGAETISEFFCRLRLDGHLGSSPGAIRGLMHKLEQASLQIAQAWEQEGIAHEQASAIIGAVDETFLERMMLVFMDLASGYVLFEEVAEDRTYATWHALVRARLAALGVEVLYLVSDRAKALVKLAEKGLECLSIPVFFHLVHDLVKSYSPAICGHLRRARQALSKAQKQLQACQASQPIAARAHQAALALVEASKAAVKHWETVQDTYRLHLQKMSLSLHPWRLAGSTVQTSEEVRQQLEVQIDGLEELGHKHGLAGKKAVLKKVRKQLAGLSALVDLWWQEVRQEIQRMALSPGWKSWVEEVLLPLLYWSWQLSRTRCSRRKAKLLQVLKAAQEVFDTHPITEQLAPDVLETWKAWASEHARAFQRASSAIEGRNGYLSQMHHNHRGLPRRRYKVWTVLHNFDCRASDGTTPASRFFGCSFPDFFEAVLSQIEDLPRPRKRHQPMGLTG